MLWRDVSRLVPWTLAATSLALGIAWAARSHLDVATERSLLAVLSTLALSAVFDDDARTLTGAVPTPLWARRMPAAAVPVVVLWIGWVAITVVVVALRTGPVESAPSWALGLEWSTVAASQLAVASVVARRPGASSSIAPGLLVATVWLAAAGAPMLHRHLQPVHAHPNPWWALLIVSLLVVCGASSDPATGRLRRTWANRRR